MPSYATGRYAPVNLFFQPAVSHNALRLHGKLRSLKSGRRRFFRGLLVALSFVIRHRTYIEPAASAGVTS